MIALDADPLARLAVLESDANLKHTLARWVAHEIAYPGLGATNMFQDYAGERFACDLAKMQTALTEFETKAPKDESTAYLRWLVAEMQHAATTVKTLQERTTS